jgi:NAD(P)-dependent dehydrogenase (short-subunit alcohol dehydrogenase family)
MDFFTGKVAIVTGGASGIGRALGVELVRRGARVVLADVNGEGAQAVARALVPSGAATGATVDVTGAAEVERVVHETVATHGRLDYLINNAGIAIMGDARHMTLADWNHLVDVNLRGVIHGIAAAYPLMIRQGFGHIVNTASLTGLTPTPGATGYATTKHAVVGLSLSLRGEAAAYGIKVSVACPGFIDTPIKDATRLLNVDRETLLKSLPFRLYPADACARDILRGVERNDAIIVVTAVAKIAWLLYRIAPRLMLRWSRSVAERSALLSRAR